MNKAEVRSSQLLTTFGPGAMMDQPDGSVIVGGLDDWRYSTGPQPIIDEPRLVAKLRAMLGRDTLTLKAPPPSSDDPTAGKPGIVVYKFPRCYLVQKPERRIGPNGQPLPESRGSRRQIVRHTQLSNGKFNDGGEKFAVVPMRFVRACEHGHLDDIDWPAFVHGYAGGCGAPIYLEEKSTTGALVDVEAVCSGCGQRNTLALAAIKGSKALGRCSGRRPWLGSWAHEKCDQFSRLLIRSASNAYFSQTLSVISIPDKRSPIDELVRELWDQGLSLLSANPALLVTLRQIPILATRLAGISDQDLLASVARVAAGVARAVERSVKDVEFEAFAEAERELGSDRPDGDFFARALPADKWRADWMKGITNVVLIHRLREVIAQVAFTRFESLGADINGELPEDDISLKVKPAAIARQADWLPAVENRGEGVFLQFDPDALEAWLGKTEVVRRAETLSAGFSEWQRAHPGSKRPFPGLPYYLLHSFSHLLMTAIALECGYPASSLRERIYALDAPQGGKRRFGLLLYTSSSDAEGTLGGLVEASRRISHFVRKALELASLCANDPVCAHHAPGELDHAPLHGAACHGCILVPETSCEQRNEFLDRALVVPTVDQCGAEFFSLP
jgi:hypothetical protein